MRAVVQKVSKASCEIDGEITGEIGPGLVALVAVGESDDEKTIEWTRRKIANLRVFPDEEGKMNRSVLDVGGGILLISNFTVYGECRKGARPNFMKAARPRVSEPLFKKMVESFRREYPIKIAEGKFGAMMNISLVNEGPVTVVIEKEND